MEPNDLKSTPPDDAQLEAWLRAGAMLPPLPDDGFSRRVVAALPPPSPRFPPRVWVCGAGALLGVGVMVIAAVTSPPATAFNPAVPDLLEALALPVALAVAALSVWFAFRDRLGFLPRLW